jgi:uncharacterized 2Fe-2S/4Fe-4S cluster protein (DUF4445 family)
MPPVRFLPQDMSVDLPKGSTLMDAAQKAGINIEYACGGSGTCGKCRVRILSGDVSFEKTGALSLQLLDQGYVLACKATLLDTPVLVEIPIQMDHIGGQFIELDPDAEKKQKQFLSEDWISSGLNVRLDMTVPPAQLEDGLSDVDRLQSSISKQLKLSSAGIQIDKINIPLSLLQKVADVLRENKGHVSVLLSKIVNAYRVIDIFADASRVEYGLAIDIGTTSIAVQLVRISDGSVVGTASDYNGQIRCGQDVINRINYANRINPAKNLNGLLELQSLVQGTINQLILKICNSTQIFPTHIYSAVISGNTTMMHLFLGLKPEYIRLEPYTPTVMSIPILNAWEVGLQIHPEATIFSSPAVGSYVGGDITAGLLCTDLDSQDPVCLFIDIGTNGELVVGNHDFLMTCACSAGPAFEGAELNCGIRAISGAIDCVDIDPATGQCSYQIIGEDIAPKGICGTGIISLLSQLFLTGWLDAAGKLDRTRSSSVIEEHGRVAHYLIVPAEKSAAGQALFISEPEIANILRSKAAIYSAISLLLDKVGLGIDELDHIFIGGNFGQFLDLDNAITLGLLPDLPLERFTYLGNSSLIGSYLLLLSQTARQRQDKLTQSITYVELNTEQAYMDQYTSALFLPHTDINLFPSVKMRLSRKQ